VGDAHDLRRVLQGTTILQQAMHQLRSRILDGSGSKFARDTTLGVVSCAIASRGWEHALCSFRCSLLPCPPCSLCFRVSILTVAKTFWEGGSGMRDRTRLSRNDSKKHANLMKTTSMKATRVGKKAGSEKPKKDANKGNNTG
jgi:hypothetical protein